MRHIVSIQTIFSTGNVQCMKRRSPSLLFLHILPNLDKRKSAKSGAWPDFISYYSLHVFHKDPKWHIGSNNEPFVKYLLWQQFGFRRIEKDAFCGHLLCNNTATTASKLVCFGAWHYVSNYWRAKRYVWYPWLLFNFHMIWRKCESLTNVINTNIFPVYHQYVANVFLQP